MNIERIKAELSKTYARIEQLQKRARDLEEQKKQALRDVEAGIKGAGDSLVSTANYNVAQMQEALDIIGGGEAYGKFTTWLSGISNKVIGTVGDLGGLNIAETYYGGVEGILKIYDAAIERKKEIAPDSEEYAALDKFVNALKSEVEHYRELIQAKKDLDGTTKAEQDAVIMQTANLIKNNARLQGYGKVLAETAGKTDEISRAKFEAATAAIQLLTDTLVANGEISREVADNIVDYYNQVAQIENPTYAAAAASGDLISALVDESGQLTDTAVQALSTDSALLAMAQAEAQAALLAANADFSGLISQLNGVSAAAYDAAAALALAGLAGEGAPSARGTYSAPRSSGFYESLAKNRGEWVQAAQNREFYQGILDDIAKINGDSENGTPGGGGGGGSAEDSFLAALEDEIDLLKSELALMRERGASEEDSGGASS